MIHSNAMQHNAMSANRKIRECEVKQIENTKFVRVSAEKP